MQPTFLFPDALCIEPTAAEPVQAIARRVFARYRQVRVVDDASAVPLEMPWEVWLKQRFALAGSASIEAASAFADGVKTPCWRVTPVHLHLGRDHLVLTNPAQLQLAFADAIALGDSIQSVLQDSGLELNVVVPDRWYLSIKDAGSHWLDGLSAQGWRAPSGRNVDAYSPTGAQSRNWRRLLNEIQMSWHEHPINEQRAAKGLPGVNSLWLDGLALPAGATDYKCCYSDLTALKGLVHSTGGNRSVSSIQSFDLPSFTSSPPSTAGKVLIAADPLNCRSADGEYQSIAVWQMIARLLSEPRANSTVILTGDRRLVELEFKARDRWAFWRKLPTDSWFEWSNRDY